MIENHSKSSSIDAKKGVFSGIIIDIDIIYRFSKFN
jgi:hypothetical protein